MSRDIVHAQRGFRRRFCGDFVNRFTEGGTLPMDWKENMQLPTGNEIRSADEILPGGQDEIPAVGGGEIRPSVGLGHRDATLLRTRYVDQRAVVNAGAFWEAGRELAA